MASCSDDVVRPVAALQPSEFSAARISDQSRVAATSRRANEKRDAHGDRYEMQELQADAGDLHLPSQSGQEIDAFRTRADDHDQSLFKKEAHRKRRDEQRLRIGASERPECGALRDEREDNGGERGYNDC